MQPNVSRVLASVVLLAAGFIAGSLGLYRSRDLAAQAEPRGELKAGLVRAVEAVPTRGSWGEWLRYYRGDTYGTKDMTVLAVTLKPGEAPHPPHQHAEEELMILAAGAGTWQVEGKDLPAHPGDVVYAAPWMMHGLKDTSTEPLTYYMVKWSGRGLPAPGKPGEPTPAPAAAAAPAPVSIAGAWDAEDRHFAMGSLYAPVHDTRQRRSIVRFEQDGDRITGWSVTPNPERISDEERWKDGKTTFRNVQLSDDRLVFEFDVEEINHGWKRGEKSKGFVHVEARVRGDRIVGIWTMHDEGAAELFRGEWEAVRALP